MVVGVAPGKDVDVLIVVHPLANRHIEAMELAISEAHRVQSARSWEKTDLFQMDGQGEDLFGKGKGIFDCVS